MYHLVYISHAAQMFTEKDLTDLLFQARAHNKQRGITGMLVYLRDRFIQVLEGDENAVDELYEKIRRDKRHKKIQVLVQGDTGPRLFSNWSMGFKSLMTADFEQLTGYQDPEKYLQQSQVNDESHPALIFLHLFFKRNLQDYPETIL